MPRLNATQDNYSFTVATPLEFNKLLFHRMEGSEQLGRLFDYELSMLSSDPDIELNDMLGQNVTVRSLNYEGKERFFNGYVSRFSLVGMHGEYYLYQASVRPWLWFLTLTSDCRIFQEKTVPDIIKEVFSENGFNDFEESFSNSYRTWTYCVQYRETDFNFISRLMEQEGIYYYFKHENGRHILVMTDSIGGHETIPGYEEVPYYPPEETDRRVRDYISNWRLTHEVLPGSYALNDFDFEKPKTDLRVSSIKMRSHQQDSFEVYDYPGEYAETDDGQSYVRTRLEALQSQYEVVNGSGNVAGLLTGCLFNLTDYGREDQNREYLVVASNYELGPQDYESKVSDASTGFHFSFKAIDSQESFRPARTTPKPVVQGPQTAIVVGPKDEELHTDEYGRVKVKFHWDRYSNADENSSCWVRVAQVWAGKRWGGMWIPRIGQEVIVEFLEGDPDRPIITGRVYNAECMPPYELPTNATISGVKSNSSKGGGGFNELRFEDKKDEEQIFINAQKNLDMRVKNDRFETIGHDRSLVIENDKKEHVKNERHEKVDNHHKESIGADRNLKVTGKEAKEVGDSLSLKVGGDVIEEFGAKHSEQVSSDYYLKATNIVIEATTNVTVKVGQSYIAIESGGIKIGTTGTIELEATSTLSAKGTAGVTVESPATTEVKGSMTTVSGDGVLTLEGGLVKIN